MRIDSHFHLWRPARGDYGWLTPAAGSLYRDHEPDEFAPLLAAHGIDAAILVQAAPSAAETEFLLAHAELHPWIAGVVGWTDMAAGGHFAAWEQPERMLADLRAFIATVSKAARE